MRNNSQGIRELIDFFIAIGAWAASIFAIMLILQAFVLPYIHI